MTAVATTTPIVRGLTSTGDWQFGAGLSSYVAGNNAIAQNIQTRLNMVLGNCFFDLGAGIDWLNLLGSLNNQTALTLAISTAINGTPGVTGLLQLNTSLASKTRNFTVQYQVQTIYSQISSNFVFSTSIG